ncbi:hypothetical protein [Nocardia acidivorans]|uniref:hypothetical protein n=1 Tax=Nocardia acidivorans TaxID=404580 RepID=UPI000832FE20|nr:hypothetical protein [Nocardia acidivorans]
MRRYRTVLISSKNGTDHAKEVSTPRISPFERAKFGFQSELGAGREEMVGMVGNDGDTMLLQELAGHPHVTEILDLLSESGCTMAMLTRFFPGQRADLHSTLGLIAAHGLLTDDIHGGRSDCRALRLTDRGESVSQMLANRRIEPATRNHELFARHRSRLVRTIGRVVNRWQRRPTSAPSSATAA